jgi:phosphoribosylformimino-5-aminoimidazole carboxamide ribotide isomerase
MLILPAIDLRNGAVVRLRQGDYEQETVYEHDPAAVATMFVDAGFRHLHVVDLDGAREGRIVNQDAVRRILQVAGVRVELGGGIRDRISIDRALGLGVWRVMIGSAAVRSPGMVHEAVRAVGAERVALAVDMRGGRVAVQGWTDASATAPDDLMRSFLDQGIKTFHCTDVSKDGMLEGPNMSWYDELRRTFPEADLIAAGGVSSMGDLDALRECGIDGAVIGRALYEGNITLPALQSWTRGGM